MSVTGEISGSFSRRIYIGCETIDSEAINILFFISYKYKEAFRIKRKASFQNLYFSYENKPPFFRLTVPCPISKPLL
jgi:hypothetical protein